RSRWLCPEHFPRDAQDAPVAQLDRAPDYESGGQEFESLRARHFSFDQHSRARCNAQQVVRRIARAYVAFSFARSNTEWGWAWPGRLALTTNRSVNILCRRAHSCGVPCRLAVEQVSHLARVVLDVVKLILEPRAAEAEVNRIDAVALADGPNMPAGSTGRKEEEIVIGEDRMVLHRP